MKTSVYSQKTFLINILIPPDEVCLGSIKTEHASLKSNLHDPGVSLVNVLNSHDDVCWALAQTGRRLLKTNINDPEVSSNNMLIPHDEVRSSSLKFALSLLHWHIDLSQSGTESVLVLRLMSDVGLNEQRQALSHMRDHEVVHHVFVTDRWPVGGLDLEATDAA